MESHGAGIRPPDEKVVALCREQNWWAPITIEGTPLDILHLIEFQIAINEERQAQLLEILRLQDSPADQTPNP